MRALVLVFGVAAYAVLLQIGHDTAQAGLSEVQNLYTYAGSEAGALSASNR